MKSRALPGLTLLLLVAAGVAIPGPLTATALESSTVPRTKMEADLVGAYNPNGLLLTLGILEHWGGAPADPLAPYIQAGAGLGVSPAYAKATARVEWMPHPMLQLRLRYDLYRYLGTSGMLLSFASGAAPYGDEEIEARQGEEEQGWGQRFMLRPVLRAMVGPLLVRNVTELAWFRFEGRGPYFLEREFDTLLKDGDWLLSDSFQVLLEAWKGAGAAQLFVGPYLEVTRAGAARITQERTGLAAAWTIADRFWGADRPRLYLQTGLHLRNPNRQGKFFFYLGGGFDIDFD